MYKRQIEYQITSEHKYRNHLISWTEVSLPLDIVERCWEHKLTEAIRGPIRENVASLDIKPLPRAPDQLPFLGYPIRIADDPFCESDDYREFEVPRFYPR